MFLPRFPSTKGGRTSASSWPLAMLLWWFGFTLIAGSGATGVDATNAPTTAVTETKATNAPGSPSTSTTSRSSTKSDDNPANVAPTTGTAAKSEDKTAAAIDPKAITTSTAAKKKSKPKYPAHLAVIMDGNGRWATDREDNPRPRMDGHNAAADRVRDLIQWCAETHNRGLDALGRGEGGAEPGIQELSLFAFARDNWKREGEEVKNLMKLLSSFLRDDKLQSKLKEGNVRLRVVGALSNGYGSEEEDRMLDNSGLFADSERDPDPDRRGQLTVKEARDLRADIREAERKSKDNTGLLVNILLDYSGKWELKLAGRRLAQAAVEQHKTSQKMPSLDPRDYLVVTREVDLLIRTGGEQRLSDFLPLQASYAEYVFEPTFFPDFHSPETIERILEEEWNNRQRRFGAAPEQVGERKVGGGKSKKATESNGVNAVLDTATSSAMATFGPRMLTSAYRTFEGLKWGLEGMGKQLQDGVTCKSCGKRASPVVKQDTNRNQKWRLQQEFLTAKLVEVPAEQEEPQ